jgi:hypothetical protein
MDSVHVVVGSCPEAPLADLVAMIADLEPLVGVTAVPFGALELTGVVACARGVVSTTPWFMMIHDTSFVGPSFVQRASEVHSRVRDTEDFDVVKLLDTFSMSVGFYRRDWVRSKAADMVSIVSPDIDSIRTLKMVVDDIVFAMADPKRTAVLGRFDDLNDRADVGRFMYKDSATDRLVEHYPSLDLYKLKSRYGKSTAVRGDCVLEMPVGV